MSIPNQENLNFDDLKDLEKDDLDRLKVAREIVSYNEKQQWETKRYRRENWQVFVIPVTLVLITGVTNFVLYQKNKDDKEADRDKDKLSSILAERRKEINDLKTKYATDVASRDAIACLIAEVPTKPEDSEISSAVFKYAVLCQAVGAKNLAQGTINSTESASKAELFPGLRGYPGKLSRTRATIGNKDPGVFYLCRLDRL